MTIAQLAFFLTDFEHLYALENGLALTRRRQICLLRKSPTYFLRVHSSSMLFPVLAVHIFNAFFHIEPGADCSAATV